jgi:hypothetical protein
MQVTPSLRLKLDSKSYEKYEVVSNEITFFTIKSSSINFFKLFGLYSLVLKKIKNVSLERRN